MGPRPPRPRQHAQLEARGSTSRLERSRTADVSRQHSSRLARPLHHLLVLELRAAMLAPLLRSAAVPARARAAARAFPASLSAPRGLRPLATSARTHQAAPLDSPSPNDKFVSSNNGYYIEEMYRQWRKDPASVHSSWNAYFSGLKHGLPSQDAVQPPPVLSDASLIQAPLGPTTASQVDDTLKACSPPPRSCCCIH